MLSPVTVNERHSCKRSRCALGTVQRKMADVSSHYRCEVKDMRAMLQQRIVVLCGGGEAGDRCDQRYK